MYLVGFRISVVIIWIAALVGFIVMSAFASVHDTFPGDLWLARRVQESDGSVFDRALDWAEDAADFPMVALMCAVVVTVLILARDYVAALILAIAVSGRVLITSGLKELIERPRPPAEILDFQSQPDTFSFPSGHAASALVLYGLILYFAVHYVEDRRIRLPLQAICVAVIALVGVERIYVGHHWPSDVVGGYYIGLLIVGGIISIHHVMVNRGSNLALPRPFSRAPTTIDPE
jgi:undecaprenyl-diphosphatase